MSIPAPARSTRPATSSSRSHAGILTEADIAGDLFDLCRGTAAGRRSDEEITLFKSVGTAIEDLAAAVAVYERVT